MWVVLEYIVSAAPVILALVLYVVRGVDSKDAGSNLTPDDAVIILAAFVLVLPIWIGIGLRNVRTTVKRADDESRERISQINGRLERINTNSVERFSTPQQYYGYLAQRAKETTKSWFDMGGFDPNLVRMPNSPQRTQYDKERIRLAQNCPVFYYMGVLADRPHLERVKKIIAGAANSGAVVKQYNADMADPSKIEVTIIDDECVVMGYFRPDVGVSQNYVAVKDPAVVALFRAYYLDVWNKGENRALKDGPEINQQLIRELDDQFPPP